MLAYAILTLLTYLAFLIFKANPLPHYLIWSATLILFFLKLRQQLPLLKNFQTSKSKIINVLITALPLIGLFLMIAIVLSILIRPINIDGHQFLTFTSAFDYNKHSYTITAITHQGLPPVHPYAPTTTMSYYYGYYLIPASLSLILPISQITILYFYVLTTLILSLHVLYLLYITYLQHPWTRFLAFTLLVIGTGWDIIPMLKLGPYFTNHVELWTQNNGLNIINTSTAFLWNPQHITAAILGIYTLSYLLKIPPNPATLNLPKFSQFPKILSTRYKILTLSLLYTTMLLTSIFVSLTILFWTSLIFLFKPPTRRPLLLAALLSLPILMPFASHLGIREASFIQPYLLNPAPITDIPVLNYIFTVALDYGPLLLLLPLLTISYTYYHHKKYLLPFTLSLAPFFWILVLRSPNANDFSMRTFLPLQLLFPLIYLKYIEYSTKHSSSTIISKYTNKLKNYVQSLLSKKSTKHLTFTPIAYLLLVLLGISLTFALPSTAYEYKHRWTDRIIIDPFETELHLTLRTLPQSTSLLAPSTDNWVFNIPIFTDKPVLSPSLFDSGVYVANSIQDIRPLENLFLQSAIQPDLSSLLTYKQDQLNQASSILAQIPSNYLILNRAIGPKQGLNPWDYIFNQIQASHTNINARYSLWPTTELIKHINQTNLGINTNNPLQLDLKDQQLDLPPGLWFLTTCIPELSHAYLEFENHYRLFDQYDNPNSCLGQLFYHQDTKPLAISNNPTIKQLTAFPIIITSNFQ